MTHQLDRLVAAQADTHDSALGELRRGRKVGHWMWWTFPQLAGLGMSPMSRHYAIADAAEARAYLAHPVLGPRLAEAMAALAGAAGSATAIMGEIDAMKLRSSMTLFEAVAEDSAPFERMLDHFFDGVRDRRTLDLLG